MTNWDAYDARPSTLTPKEEAVVISRLAKERARAGRSHRGGCLCVACQVRRADANMRALRKIAADAKAAA